MVFYKGFLWCILFFKLEGEIMLHTHTQSHARSRSVWDEMRFLLASPHPAPWKVGSTASMCSIAGAHTHAACLSFHKVRHHPGKSGKRGRTPSYPTSINSTDMRTKLNLLLQREYFCFQSPKPSIYRKRRKPWRAMLALSRLFQTMAL